MKIFINFDEGKSQGIRTSEGIGVRIDVRDNEDILRLVDKVFYFFKLFWIVMELHRLINKRKGFNFYIKIMRFKR